jgi:hypothetical protein
MFMAFVQLLVQFIVGLVWAFLLSSIVNALMRVVTKRQRPTLWHETNDICVKVALLGVFPWFFAVRYNFLMGTAMYAAVTFLVAISLLAIRTIKPPKQRFEEELARERKVQAMLTLCEEAISFVKNPDADDDHQTKRCDLLRSIWEGLTAEQRKVAPLMAEGNTSKAIADKLNISVRIAARVKLVVA